MSGKASIIELIFRSREGWLALPFTHKLGRKVVVIFDREAFTHELQL
jgi:hypothetical protein